MKPFGRSVVRCQLRTIIHTGRETFVGFNSLEAYLFRHLGTENMSGQVRELFLCSGPTCHHSAAGPQAAQGGSGQCRGYIPGSRNRPGKVKGLRAGALWLCR